jgi:hypothetical protein
LILEEQSVEHVCKVMGMTQDAVFQWRSRIAKRAREIAAGLLPERTDTLETLEGKPQS